jgi:hypothetical protein
LAGARPRLGLPQGRDVIAIPLGTLAVLLLAALMIRRVFDILWRLIPPHEHPPPQADSSDRT